MTRNKQQDSDFEKADRIEREMEKGLPDLGSGKGDDGDHLIGHAHGVSLDVEGETVIEGEDVLEEYRADVVELDIEPPDHRNR